MSKSEKIGIIGLGYVGLPVALAFARKYKDTIGFDISRERIHELSEGVDRTRETPESELKSTTLKFTANPADLKGITFFVVCVPTPVDSNNRPDLGPVISASETVGRVLESGAVVVYESTVYPGVTEDICGPILEKLSGLKRGKDFKLGYSPERINPGDREHALEKVTKVVSGEDAESLDRVAAAYGSIVEAGVFKAKSIKVAEAAKVIENTQRDLNIAFMNELSLIFDKLGIRTKDVLEAAGTKWNFLRFSPGLVGGHCIGVDPYYLTMKAEEVGYHPQVILSGRRINDGMGKFIAEKAVKLRVASGKDLKDARAGILGLTFKENVPDIRNSRVPDILKELREFGVKTIVHDPQALADEAMAEYGVKLSPLSEFKELDILIVAVSHREYMSVPPSRFSEMLRPGGVLVDVKGLIEPDSLPKGTNFWSL
jgi:UDP-N-acetyl-D-galactosamine dehydrogenase